jgi:Methyltransferase domain
MILTSLTRGQLQRLRRYARQNRKRIKGWLGRADAEIFATVLSDQVRRRVSGSPLEIGVHHGRSFIPLSLTATADDPAIAIDIFEKQEHNQRDPSGRGDYRIFQRNLQRFGEPDVVDIISDSSLDVTPERIGRELRFVSVDGAHWREAVLSDLRLVSSCAGPDCVVALDDFFNPDYSGVTQAYFEWSSTNKELAPFAISRGKLYLCRPEHLEHYQSTLLQNEYLKFNNKKTSDFMGQRVLVITGLFSGALSPAKRYLQIKAPILYARLLRLKAQVREIVTSRKGSNTSVTAASRSTPDANFGGRPIPAASLADPRNTGDLPCLRPNSP